ncbi:MULTISPECIES: hypothetical protein [Caulobacter]|uniref:Uncharacterized protein n=1 Tax=Caulobacter segnis TaxID=88688 RepID=A0ABY5A0P5_9CAUL|nr:MULTISPECIES: hypothetical protein [Caulobacter]MBO9546514.1 hypothetical protein [Caulobacter sp.]UAL13117.1 hypothetical protein K8940_21200 [Caulobacter segnis]USQ98483.1 hypothetical protein MZV50_02470 [Caulobacter segnis]
MRRLRRIQRERATI